MIKVFTVFKHNFITNLLSKLGITGRGWLIITFIIVLLSGPIRFEQDITATIIVETLAFILICALAVTFLQKYFLKRLLTPAIFQNTNQNQSQHLADLSSEGKVFSNIKTPLILKFPACRIWPLFNLSVTWNFKNEAPAKTELVLKGHFPITQNLANEITFPHRGIWEIENVMFKLSDQLGLTCFNWEIVNREQKYTVYPQPVTETHFPVLSSFYRTGDLITGSKERHGEPLDLKRYHPSDGINKISWKIFARSRVLMSRHQEAASSPEGEVAVFCLARPNDDLTASATLAYINKLLDADLEILFSCLGQSTEVATTKEEAEKLLLKEVWNIRTDHILNDVSTFISKVQERQPNLNLRSLLLFLNYKILEDEKAYSLLSQVASKLEERQIEVVFCFTGLKPKLNLNKKHTSVNKISKTKLNLKNKLFGLFLPTDKTEEAKSFYPELMQQALQHHWQTYSEEDYR